jgi:hypothetical protein
MTFRRMPDSIERISVSGFKSIASEQSIAVAPLTILAGANSSGKSSMLQPLLLLKQTLEAPYDPGPLLLEGPNVKFTSSEQLLFRSRDGSHQSEFSVQLELESAEALRFHFKKGKEIGLSLCETAIAAQETKLSLHPDMSSDDLRNALPEHYRKRFFFPLEKRGQTPGNAPTWEVYRDRCFFRIAAKVGKGLRIELPPAAPMSVNDDTRRAILSTIHLPGLRGNPERTYPVTAAGPRFQGTFQNYAASVIAQWQQAADGRLEQLGECLRDLGLTWKVQTKPVDETKVELRVGRMPEPQRGGAHDMVSIADVGVGVSQVLPVVVALLVSEPGCLVYLEQPEIHLHPRAQVQLARLLVDAANRGVKVVAETHSALLLLSVQTLIVRGDLSPDSVRLHWFTRTDGVTNVHTADLRRDGSFGDWPEDFGDVQLQSQREYLDAVEQLQLALRP